ncbi:MAG: HAD family hydrolase [Acidimicrobiales bacterium]
MALEALIFDFDGLILDTEWPVYRSIAAEFERHGLTYALESWVHVVGTSHDVDWAGELEHRLARAVNREEAERRRRTRFAELMAAAAVLPGVLDLLDAADAAGIAVGVASSSPRSWVAGHLADHGLAGRFDAVITLDDVGVAKPAPDLYLAALAALAVPAAGAVALEDSAHGCTAAKAAGIRVVAAPNAVTAGLDFAHADLLVPSLAALSLAELAALTG